MNELQRGRVQRNPRNPSLRGFSRTVLAITDHWMTQRCKLHPDLILQSGE
jgi:hypothetical protein